MKLWVLEKEKEREDEVKEIKFRSRLNFLHKQLIGMIIK